MKIAFFSHTGIGGAFVVGSHHLAKVMAGVGHEVTHVSAAVSVGHLAVALKSGFVRVRLARWLRGGESFGGVRDVVPFTLLPWALARLSPALMNGYSRLMLASPYRGFSSLKLEAADCLLVDDPRFVGFVTQHSDTTIVYRATDLYSIMRNDPKLIRAETLLCNRADLLVATSEPVAAHLRRISGRLVHIISNGVDFEHFTQSRTASPATEFNLPGRRGDRAVYAGAFDRRFGRDALRAAAIAMPGRYFVLIGPGGKDVVADLRLPNVVALGAVAYSKLPRILQECAVGLLPMSNDAANSGRSPMKLYEYVAAGLAVAATATDELRRHQLPTLSLGSGDTEFCSAVARAFNQSGDARLLTAACALAQQESWAGKAQELLGLIASTVSAHTPGDAAKADAAACRCVEDNRVQ